MSPSHDPNDPSCRDMFARLSEFIDRELDTATYEEIEHHLADCLPCQACIETLKRTTRLCRQMKTQPVPRHFSQRLRALVSETLEQAGS